MQKHTYTQQKEQKVESYDQLQKVLSCFHTLI